MRRGEGIRRRGMWIDMADVAAVEMATISVIVPAHDAQATLARTLDSLRAQNYPAWEAIVVDDGSSDATAQVAGEQAAADARIRLLQQPQGGASAARNAGLAVATGKWVTFLDADDMLRPGHFAAMLAAAEAAPSADVLHCGWRRWSGGVPWRNPHPARRLDDAMLETARACPFAIHAALTRRASIVNAGGFDPALRIAEDWDLWQRLARIGAKFAPVADLLVDVHVQPGSLSSNTERHLTDGLAVIRRGHGTDDRLPADVVFADGAPDADLPDAAWWFALWLAGAAIGRGEDSLPLLDAVGIVPPVTLDTNVAAGIIEDGLAIGIGAGAGPAYRRWSDLAAGVAALCRRLDELAGSAIRGAAVRRALEARVAEGVPVGEEVRIGSIATVVIDPLTMLRNRALPGVDRIRMSVVIDNAVAATVDQLGFGALSGARQRAVLQTHVDEAVLRRRLLDQRIRGGPFGLGLSPLRGVKQYVRLLRSKAWPDRHHHAKLPHQDVVNLLYQAEPSGPAERAADTRFADIVAQARADTLGDAVDKAADTATPWVEPDYTREDYWESIFDRVDPWEYRNDYETFKYDQTLDLIREIPIATALEIACAEGEFTRRLAAHAGHVLATDIAPTAVARAAEACADLNNCAFQRLDLLTEDPPASYDLIVASEVLYYLEPDALAAFTEKVSRHLNPGGIFLTAHGNLLVDEPDCTGFGWPHHFGAKGIGDAFSARPELTLETELWTPIYRIMRFRKASAARAEPLRIIADAARNIPDRVAAQIRWRGGQEAAVAPAWNDFPILMYHRIAIDGPAALAQWRTAPAAFEEQLAHLRDNGWYGVSLSRLHQALHEGAALPERSVMLTFDDATRDFLDHAVPLLNRYGFPATLFVPVGHVGSAALWDAAHGDPAPLLDWDEIRALRFRDVALGAHGVSHRPLTALHADEVVRELAEGRFRLERELDGEVRAIAYPYGAFDPAVRDAAFETGYRLAFSCADGLISQDADSVVLKRREVVGGMTLAHFAALIAGG